MEYGKRTNRSQRLSEALLRAYVGNLLCDAGIADKRGIRVNRTPSVFSCVVSGTTIQQCDPVLHPVTRTVVPWPRSTSIEAGGWWLVAVGQPLLNQRVEQQLICAVGLGAALHTEAVEHYLALAFFGDDHGGLATDAFFTYQDAALQDVRLWV